MAFATVVRKAALPVIAAAACCVAAAASRAEPAPANSNIAGTWDLIWQKRRGPERNGYLQISQSGAELVAEIHGQGSVKARGRIAGRDFVLLGSRMAIPYRIAGRVEGDRLSGSLKILSIERRFTGERRIGR